jgi:hypothetical protein
MHKIAKDAALEILRFSEDRIKKGFQPIWPAFWGHTGAGKTTMARIIAEETGKKVETLLLHSMQPEDVLGLPDLGRGPVNWRQSSWVVNASSQPTLVLLDEIDKARPEVIATVLTALASHEVRGVKLHPKTAFILAGQPVPSEQFLADATGEALSARVSWLFIGYDWDSLSSHLATNLSWLPPQESTPLPILPRPNPRHLHWAITWIRQRQPEKELANIVLQGMFPKEAVDKLYESANEIDTNKIAGKELAEALSSNLALAGKLPLSVLGKTMADIWHHGNLKLLCLALKRLWVEGDPEMVYGSMSTAVDELSSRASGSGGEINVLGDSTEEEVLKALEATAIEIADIYVKRNEEKEKKVKKEEKKKK